jgi:glucosylceramidase
MKGINSGIIAIGLTLLSCNSNKSVEWVESSPISTWQTRELTAKNISGIPESGVIIFPDKKQQSIEGFGGCFNELGWEALSLLNRDAKEEIFKSLFDTTAGCRFNICRLPVGANDYAVDWYSCDESPGDFEMSHFSIERDRPRLIPYIKSAQNYNPDLKVWASPWCPPSWMKTNNHYACKPDTVNDLTEEGKGEEMHTQFRMEEKYLTAYALYFSKFINAYRREGIDIYALHVQNEPNSCQNFPSCIWEPKALGEFIGKYLGPEFEKDGIGTEVWLGTIERPQIERIDAILNDPEAKKYIMGVGFQWAGKDAIPLVSKKYPNLKLMQTETECGDGSNDWKAAEHTFGLIKHYFNNGANAYMYWNMVLNESGKSQWGWKQNSMISINSITREVTYNPEYYLMQHFSHFIHPGAYKIESSDENCLAFRNHDSIIIEYYNASETTMKKFRIGKLTFEAELPGKSFNTFNIKM